MARIPTGLSRGGVYRIRNIKNGKIYIGSSSNLRKRRNRHWDQLRAGTHHSVYLQRSFVRYGHDAFVFEVLDYIDDENKRLNKEQFYIVKLKPGYNACKMAASTKGYKHRPATIKKMSESRMGHIVTPETNAKKRQAMILFYGGPEAVAARKRRRLDRKNERKRINRLKRKAA